MDAKNVFALNHEDAYTLLTSTGHFVTYVFEGEVGIGKTSIQKMFVERDARTPSGLPYEAHIYFDGNTKDVGDVCVPMVTMIEQGKDGQVSIVRSAVHEELGLHIKGPVTVMLDEIGKALPPVQNVLTRFCNERKLGQGTLHPESVVFGTTNLSEENVGDMFRTHQLDRINIQLLRKPTVDELLLYGINHNWNDHVLGFLKDTPELLQSFKEVSKPEDNPYINHPQAIGRRAFVTPRGLERGAKIVDLRDHMSDNLLHAALMGEWGVQAAADFMATLHLREKMPSKEDIQKDPEHCKLPDNDAAMCSVIFSALRRMDEAYITPWMKYLMRADTGMQALFMASAADTKYKHNALVMNNALVTRWAMTNRHIFAADQA